MKKLALFACAFTALIFTNCDKEPVGYDSSDNFESNFSFNKQSNLNGTSIYVSSNTSGVLGIFDISTGMMSPTLKSINVPYADADGVEYDGNRDAVYQVNRTDKNLVAVANISRTSDGDLVTPSAIGPSSFTNGRGSALYNNKVVIADDIMPGRLASYHVNDDQISDFRNYNVGFKVWDVQVTGKDLWAIEDLTNILAYFQNFHNAKSGDLPPTAEVAIEGLVRTHGLNYDTSSDTMVLTDIGSAAGMPNSASDGALIIIKNFTQKFHAAGDGGMISLSDQIRIAGDMTQLGNPVDVAISSSKGAIFVAERAQQKLLIFDIPTENCNCAPVYSTAFAGASSVTTDF
ncbi:hypothetical protein ACFO5O_02105 [Geojedonia litorea]|uniref:Uncharacterized protein n=1 Tax=Geojedonia litorea TaxID=1268269 RepID=A0ABV9MYL9_9FLAO